MQSSGKANSNNYLANPENCALILIDYQAQPLFGVQSQDRTLLINAAVGLAKAARAFNVPTVLTTLASETLNGPIFPELQEAFPRQECIDRTCINAFEDKRFLTAVAETKRKRLLVAGLWTEVSVNFSVCSALEEGYNVQVVADASGGTSLEAHQLAIQQMSQAGALPRTWQQIAFGWQRDWEQTETADKLRQILRQHSGVVGQGLNYIQAISNTRSNQALQAPRRGLRPVGMER
jgi:nicotinamidase-related amidase